MKRGLQIFWLGFQRVGRSLGTFNTSLIMILSFYLLVFPLALLRRLFSRRPSPHGWIPRPESDPKHFERQF